MTNPVEQGRPVHLIGFIHEVLVKCPSCGRAATVMAKAGLREKKPTVRCPTCGFSRSGWPAPDGKFLDAITRRRCPRCERWLDNRYQRFLAGRREVVLSCPCKAQTTVAVYYGAIRLGRPFDPYFGYPVWLQKDVGRKTLWAYNRRHLGFLKAYVAAVIRVRTPHANASLASRLPAWISKGTRRVSILKTIAAIERRAA
jgi:DNA-directed RNA polymerase subunit RPC12/RpoP